MLFCDAGSGRAAALAERGRRRGRSRRSPSWRCAPTRSCSRSSRRRSSSAAEQLGGAGDAIASVLGATPLARLRELFPGRPGDPGDADDHDRGPARRDLPRAARSRADGEAGARLLNLFGELSHLVEVPDELMDAATAVMGCSPAYLAVVVQNLAEAGAAEGLDPEQAYELVLETFAGTIELLRRYDPITVRQSVASRGGSTEAGLEALADAGVADGVPGGRRAPRSSGCAGERS